MTLQEKIEQLFTKTEFDANDHELFSDNRADFNRNNFPDLISLTLHRFVAQRLMVNPQLIRQAESNLDKWLVKNPTVAAWLEWKRILETENLDKILKIITAETGEGQRLRSSSPFVGLLSKEERRTIIEECEKARPF